MHNGVSLNPSRLYFCLSVDTSNGLEVLADVPQVGGTEVVVEGPVRIEVDAVFEVVGVVGLRHVPVEVLAAVQPDVAGPHELALARQVVQADPHQGRFHTCRISFHLNSGVNFIQSTYYLCVDCFVKYPKRYDNFISRNYFNIVNNI